MDEYSIGNTHEALKHRLIEYIETAYLGKNDELRDLCKKELEEQGVLWKEPYIEANPAYKTIENGINESDKIPDGIKKEIDKGVFLVERKDETDLSVFEEKYGYTLPTEINDYINLFWHPCIRGYCNTKESIVLFSVLKKEGDSSDDILFYENSLISMAKDWEEMDIDGEVEDKPIANSLKELINNMNVNPNIRKKEENKCCL